MRINADFSQRVVVRPENREWVKSPANGVERMMLDRIGEEVARATTIVRFAPGSQFDAHTHGGGEEFFVLEGVFSDETGDYPAGTYVRNPIGTSHTPHTDDGCTIFVKLHQFDADDQEQFHIDTTKADFRPGSVPGLSVLPLHSVAGENVALVRWEPGTRFTRHRHWGGEEILVLEGTFQDEHGDYPAGTWLRSPHMSEHTPFSEGGCLIYVKTGHLTPDALPA
ncbi:cupin domain-containing protein [Shimia sp. CNT1-13L.2]|uniref:cupin domain-containing protein n=1 Tax=Shimia sp. CNT1-13L.2 TaxID=2959663 RepID=UPI0020CC7A43|nr:cupin domain-containing protein [Shimia sp. CNT1-13L.2]MCP9484131.1 cupin domain-containing protein [Shimia sp. CNT1-13L.2]